MFLPRGILHLETEASFTRNKITQNKLQKILCFNCFHVLKSRLYLTHKCLGQFITLS